jgi:23S rRNA (cytidine1920-2'-O)/16S rRNA (cytidine1409-2'-O)-methyltransferase
MPQKTTHPKKRLDLLLVEQGYAANQGAAQAMVMAGEVTVDGIRTSKPGTQIYEGAKIGIAERAPYVSRGGPKLAYALEQFSLDITGKTAADIGASTGGFTDCLLKHGARQVYAVDVGKGQLDWGLRKDERVVVMEEVNARFPLAIPEKVDLVTMDVSFISVTKVIPPVTDVLEDKGFLIVLVKPQFEALRREVGKGGVVREAATHALVLGRFLAWANTLELRLCGLVPSPIEGAAGNREFLVLLKKEPVSEDKLT